MKWIIYFFCITRILSFIHYNGISIKNHILSLYSNRDPTNEITIFLQKTGSNTISLNSSIYIDKDIDTVFLKMSDYNKLSDFIPNLDKSYIISTYQMGNKTYTKVFQQGSQRIDALNMNFSAAITMNMCEEKGDGKRFINFTLDKSNIFSTFSGSWIMTYDYVKKRTVLTYILHISPKMFFPFDVIIGKVKKYIQSNLYAIKDTIEK